MKLYLHKAILVGVGALLAQGVSAQTLESAAVLQAKAIRLDVEAKKKALEEDQRNAAPAATPTPAAPLELAIDATDSPGATKQ
jgi:hypothetical protein